MLYILIVLLVVGVKIYFSMPKTIGDYGELKVSYKLSWLSDEYVVLNDILLPTYYGTTQIDHIVVSPYGIFVIETKNYKGWIFGHEKSENWKQSLLGKRVFWIWTSNQYKFRNPIRQNSAHVKALESLLKHIGDFTIIPIVVFSDDATLNITTPNNIVVNERNLRNVIKLYKTICIDSDTIQEIVNQITAANITDKEIRKNHVANIRNIQHKKDQLISNNICPKCGNILIERTGRYGSFLGCSNYPKCTYTRNLK